MNKRLFSLVLALTLALSCASCGQTQPSAQPPVPSVAPSAAPSATPAPAITMVTPTDATMILLSDDGVTVDGTAASTSAEDAVYVGGEIIYYKDGTDATYGEGSQKDMHSAREAAEHTVVTITKPGAYRISGKLSRGQIFVDLGKDAKTDPNAAVTLILDGADITCTVAPGVFFYNVYECDTDWVAYDEDDVAYTPSSDVDTSAAGANVILAAGSTNTVNGSHVARIYKEGTTKKLHKYDAAFYSRMSMNLFGDNGDDSGTLTIVADNEGLDSELHLSINGGTISITADNDGINTNEDGVSVTSVNGGNLTVNAGLGAEGDGIDSNGWLVINGGTIWTMANESSPDGGIDADNPILLNGGTLYAFGTRNDAAGNTSFQPYMELSFASTLPAGSEVKVTDTKGTELWSATTLKRCQAITLTLPALALDTVYNVYVDGVLQCYSGNSSGMMFPGGMGGGNFGGIMPEGFDPNSIPNMENFGQGSFPNGGNFDPNSLPNGGNFGGGFPSDGNFGGNFDPSTFPAGGQRPENMQRPNGGGPSKGQQSGRPANGFDPGTMGGNFGSTMPEGFDPSMIPGGMGGNFGGGNFGGGFGNQNADGSGSTEFILTAQIKSFSGVCDSDASGKTRVSFTVEGPSREGRDTLIEAITAITPSVDVDPTLIQVTVADNPSEDYSVSCLLSDGLDAVNDLLPDDAGNYLLTVAVVSGNAKYTGATQVAFTIPAE